MLQVDQAVAGRDRGHEAELFAEGELPLSDISVEGLRGSPRRRAGRRVAGMTNGDMSVEGRKDPVVERLRHKAHVFDDRDVCAVADRYPSRLLATVLKGIQTEIGEVRYWLTRSKDSEYTACFAGLLEVNTNVR